MENVLYKFLNVFFFVFHVALIVFNLFGWIWTPLRKWNLVTLGLTAFSWGVLGIFYGFGYCFLTDWHWAVRDQLGYDTSSHSYVHFLVTEPTGISIGEGTVDLWTGILFVAAVVLSIWANVRDKLKS